MIQIIPAIIGAMALAQSGGDPAPISDQQAQLERLKAELAEIIENDRRDHEARYCAEFPAACYFDGTRLRPIPDPGADVWGGERRGVDPLPARYACNVETC